MLAGSNALLVKMDNLDDALLITVVAHVSPLNIFKSIPLVSRRFHTICSPSSALWSKLVDPDYQVEYQLPQRTFENSVKFAQEVQKVKKAWQDVAPYFENKNKKKKEKKKKKKDNEEKKSTEDVCAMLQAWMEDFLRDEEQEEGEGKKGATKKRKKHVSLPLQFRLFLRETKGKGFHWRGEECVCDINSTNWIVEYNMADDTFYVSRWLYVAGESDEYPVTLCCDPKSKLYGAVYKYSSYGGFYKPKSVSEVNATSWLNWIIHMKKKAHLYDNNEYDTDEPDESGEEEEEKEKDKKEKEKEEEGKDQEEEERPKEEEVPKKKQKKDCNA
eukprot:Phypoly_transcript_11756.p1 GENE.Phypoly_transcript_11756~~Phypoly_transcript_11756.p1  ORF type:complete len:329 (+),score=94.07 Phypoly_transcript_11756:56-1042(+)